MQFEDLSYCFRLPTQYIQRYIFQKDWFLASFSPEEKAELLELYPDLLPSVPTKWSLKATIIGSSDLIRV
jgi:hypothetical protein